MCTRLGGLFLPGRRRHHGWRRPVRWSTPAHTSSKGRWRGTPPKGRRPSTGKATAPAAASHHHGRRRSSAPATTTTTAKASTGTASSTPTVATTSCAAWTTTPTTSRKATTPSFGGFAQNGGGLSSHLADAFGWSTTVFTPMFDPERERGDVDDDRSIQDRGLRNEKKMSRRVRKRESKRPGTSLARVGERRLTCRGRRKRRKRAAQPPPRIGGEPLSHPGHTHTVHTHTVHTHTHTPTPHALHTCTTVDTRDFLFVLETYRLNMGACLSMSGNTIKTISGPLTRT